MRLSLKVFAPLTLGIIGLAGTASRAHAKSYSAEINTSATLDSGSVKIGDGGEQSRSSLSADLSWLFILRQFELGPVFSYSTSSFGGTTSSALAIGPMFKYNFGLLGSDPTLPFAYAGLELISGENSYLSLSGSYSGTDLVFGGGVNFMMGPNLSFQPRLERYQHWRKTASGNTQITAGGFQVLFGISVFI